MKKFKLICFLISAVVVVACDEEFSPKADFEESYVMNCIVSRSKYTSSFSPNVYLFNTYNVDGTNPLANNVDPTLSGAKVFLEYGRDQIFELEEDTSIVYLEDTVIVTARNQYNNPVISYQAEDLAWTNGDMKIKAVLPNGKEIKAVSQMPKSIYFEYSYPFARGITSAINQWKHGDSWGIYWKPVEGHLYFAEFYIYYSKKGDDGTSETGRVKVPTRIVNVNGKNQLRYPDKVDNGKIEIKFDALDYAMKSIAGDDPEKEKYFLNSIEMNVVEYDVNLSKYYSSINGSLDDFSIRIDQTTFTNIDGGYGIFGCMRLNQITHKLGNSYIMSFGYNYN